MTDLQRMKWLASGLLLLAAAVYAIATWLEPRHAWLHYVSATAEAAMVGAIADWFAVTALFHHPLNLRFIPHTAIIPRNKGRIARGLAEFIQQNFLSAAAVVARIAAFQPAQTLCRWLLRPENADTVAGYGCRFLAYGLGAVDDERVRRFLQQNLKALLMKADVAGAAAQVLDVLTENHRHHELLDAALAALDEVLAREETQRYIAREVARNVPFLLRGIVENFGLDEKAALRIVDIAVKKIAEIRLDRDHELRRRFDAFVAGFVARLKTDAALRLRVFRMRDELMQNPALERYLGGLWQDLRAWLAADLQGGSAVHRKIASAARAMGGMLDENAEIRSWIDEQILRSLPPLVEEHRAAIGRFIEDQINGWQERKLVGELERHIGPDLQYIRINGTLVGGLAGLLIAAATQLARG
jgi:uncharacterized membrane-anchored protein YjiN (DUF445 family)